MSTIRVILVGAGDDRQLQAQLAGPNDRLVCLYRAPWDAALGPDGRRPAAIDAWTRQHAAVLQAWRNAPDRVVLVNLSQLSSAEDAVARLAALGVALAPDQLPVQEWTEAPPWARALAAACIAEFAPRALEYYDALEACAQLPGGAADGRGGATAGGPDLDGMLDRIGEALASLSALQRESNQHAAAEAAASSRAGDAEELELLRQKNELLAFQAEQLQEELALGEAQADEAARLAQRAATLGARARMVLSRLALLEAQHVR